LKFTNLEETTSQGSAEFSSPIRDWRFDLDLSSFSSAFDAPLSPRRLAKNSPMSGKLNAEDVGKMRMRRRRRRILGRKKK
jgi:hypothetical protein